MENRTSYLEWPVPNHIEGILGDMFRPMMLGWLFEMAEAIGSPIVFWYRDANGGLASIEEMRKYDYLSPVCAKLRENEEFAAKCKAQDKKFAEISYKNVDGVDPKHMLVREYILEPDNMLKYGIYVCDTINLTEWLVPVVINGHWLGAFITGQFVDPQKIATIIKKLSSHGQDMTRSELIKRVPSKVQKDDFFELIKRYINFIKDEMSDSVRLTLQGTYEEMKPYLRGNKFETETQNIPVDPNPLVGFSQLTERFQRNRTRLFESGIVFRERLGLKGIHIFKPISKLDGMAEEKVLTGANLNTQTIETEDTDNRTRMFTPTEYTLDLPLLRTQLAEHPTREGADRTLIEIILEANDIENVLTVPQDASVIPDFTNAVMMVYATTGFESYPIVYILFFSSEDAKNLYLTTIEKFNVLSQASALYLTKWYALYADYQRCVSGALNQLVSHEIGNALTGMKLDLEKLEKSYRLLLPANFIRSSDLYGLYKEIDGLIDVLKDYIPSAQLPNDLISLVSGMADSALLTRKPDLQQINPNLLLHRICYTYDPHYRDSNKRLIGPSTLRDDKKHMEIDVDEKLFQIIANNLIHNAYKYSYENTRTFVRSGRHPRTGVYRLIVSSYGSCLTEAECKSIFEMGYRTEEAKGQIFGMGMGLYLVKNFVEKHKGKAFATSKKVCNYHFGYLRGYMFALQEKRDDILSKFTNEEKANFISAYTDYKDTPLNGRTLFFHKGKTYMNPRYIKQFINLPTARNTFIVEFPKGVII